MISCDQPNSELPRVLNVQQFTAAREAELRGLWESLRILGRLESSKLLPRHLRRRATSHRRYICRRRRNLKLAQNAQQQIATAGPDAAVAPPSKQIKGAQKLWQAAQPAAAVKKPGQDTDMPDVQLDEAAPAAQAALVAAGVVASAAGSDVRPLNRRQRRRPALLQQLVEASCRLDLAASTAAADDASDAAAGGGDGDSVGQQRRRLETHTWHARRMRMCKRYGHALAAGVVGKGHGSRSFLHQIMPARPRIAAEATIKRPGGTETPRFTKAKRSKAASDSKGHKIGKNSIAAATAAQRSAAAGRTQSATAAQQSAAATTVLGTMAAPAAAAAGATLPVRAVCHDASYWCCLQLRGQQEQLIHLLSSMTDPVLLQQQLAYHEVLAGCVETQLILHQPGQFPAGTIGPVKIMWHQQQQQQRQRLRQKQRQRRQQQHLHKQEQQQLHANGYQKQQQHEEQILAGCTAQQHSMDRQQQQSQRLLWLWCHPACFKQVHDTISSKVQQAEGCGAELCVAETQVNLGVANADPAQPPVVVSLAGVEIHSLCGSMRRLELLGPSADQVLLNVITQQQQQQHNQQQQQHDLQHLQGIQQSVVSQNSSSGSKGGNTRSYPPNKVWTVLSDTLVSAWLHLPEGCVLGLAALDPRLAKPLRHSGAFKMPLDGPSSLLVTMHTAAAAVVGGGDTAACSSTSISAAGGDATATTAARVAAASSTASVAIRGGSTQGLKQLLNGWPHNGRKWLSPAGRALLAHFDSFAPAAPEVLVSTWRRQQQQAAHGLEPFWHQQHSQFAAADISASCRGFSGVVTCSTAELNVSPYGITSRLQPGGGSCSTQQQQQFDATATAQLPVACPILLIRQHWGRSGTPTGTAGWSLLLPAGWVMPFWTALTHAGAKPAGLREWFWAAAVHQTPLQALDYPDSAAAATTARELHQEIIEYICRRPLGRVCLQCLPNPGIPEPYITSYLDWSRLGQQLQMLVNGRERPVVVAQQQPAVASAVTAATNSATAAGAASGESNNSREVPMAVDSTTVGEEKGDGGADAASADAASLLNIKVCWAALGQLHAAARAVKRQQRQHRLQLKMQGPKSQQQQLHIRQQQQQPPQATTRQPSITEQRQRLQEQQQQWWQQWWQQRQQSLLPDGWYVARSWRALQFALPSTIAAAQHDSLQAIATTAAQGAVTAASTAAAAAAPRLAAHILASGRGRNRALSKAVQQGQLTWQPKRSSTPDCTSAGAVSPTPAAPAGGAARNQPDPTQQLKGVADPMDVDQQNNAAEQQQQHCQQEQAVEAAGGLHNQQQLPGKCLVRVAVRVIGQGSCHPGALLVTQVPAATSNKSSNSADNNRSGSNVVQLLGYVVSAMPHGAPAALYPGGTGVCDMQHLWRLRCQDVSANSSRVLRAWLVNPCSRALRKVELTVLLDD